VRDVTAHGARGVASTQAWLPPTLWSWQIHEPGIFKDGVAIQGERGPAWGRLPDYSQLLELGIPYSWVTLCSVIN